MNKKKNREEFAQAIDRRLSGLQGDPHLAQRIMANGKGEEPMVKKTSAAVIIMAALIALLTTGALAAALNAWGLIDFAGRHPGTFVPANYEDSVRPENETLETDSVSCTVRESYFDGRILRLTAQVTAKANMLLIGADSSVNTPISDLFWQAGDAENEQEEETIGAYALREYAGKLAEVSLGAEIDCADASLDYMRNEDGSYTFYLEYAFEEERTEIDVPLKLGVIPMRVYTDGQEEEEVVDRESRESANRVMSFHSVATKTLLCETPMDFPKAGVRVNCVTFTVTPLEIRYALDYEVTDPEAFKAQDGGLWFEFIDPDSDAAEAPDQRVSSGLMSGSTVTRQDSESNGMTGSEMIYRQTGSIGLNALGEQYTIRAFNAWDKARYESTTFSVKEKP